MEVAGIRTTPSAATARSCVAVSRNDIHASGRVFSLIDAFSVLEFTCVTNVMSYSELAAKHLPELVAKFRADGSGALTQTARIVNIISYT